LDNTQKEWIIYLFSHYINKNKKNKTQTYARYI
jgi:hypothetical protein